MSVSFLSSTYRKERKSPSIISLNATGMPFVPCTCVKRNDGFYFVPISILCFYWARSLLSCSCILIFLLLDYRIYMNLYLKLFGRRFAKEKVNLISGLCEPRSPIVQSLVTDLPLLLGVKCDIHTLSFVSNHRRSQGREAIPPISSINSRVRRLCTVQPFFQTTRSF